MRHHLTRLVHREPERIENREIEVLSAQDVVMTRQIESLSVCGNPTSVSESDPSNLSPSNLSQFFLVVLSRAKAVALDDETFANNLAYEHLPLISDGSGLRCNNHSCLAETIGAQTLSTPRMQTIPPISPAIRLEEPQTSSSRHPDALRSALYN